MLIVATWNGGELERSDYESWRAFHELADSPEAVRELVFVQSMATAGAARGLEEEQHTRFELEGLRQKVLVPALRRHVVSDISVSDDEIEELRRDHPEAYTSPRKLRLRNIFKKIDDESQASGVRDRMEEIHAQLLAGSDFLDMARRESESQTRFRDGNLGFIALEDLPPVIAAAVSELEPGQISDVIEHDGGLTIMLCEEAREARDPTPGEVSEKIRATMVRRRTEQQWNDFQRELYTAAAPKLKPHSEEFVLEMDGYRLKAADLHEIAALRVPNKAPQDFTDPELMMLLRSWATGELSVRRAVDLGLDQDPETAAALKWGGMGTLAHLELVRLVDERLEQPTEEELRSFFESHSKRFMEPQAYDLEIIHFAAPDVSEQPESIRRAAKMVSRIESGEMSFADAARRSSIHPSAADGGHIGWLAKGQIARFGPVAASAIRTMNTGESSGLLRLESGLWLIKVLNKRSSLPSSFEAVRDRVGSQMRTMKIRELERAVREEHLADIDLQISGVAEPD